jgi:tetratricopeptide (TPR) repeat protein
MGLNAAAAQQIVGDIAAALTTAERCEKFFKERAILTSQSQAAYTVGSCHARTGNWSGAYTAWSRAVRLDDEQCAFIQASERRALLVQGLVMGDMGSRGSIRPATIAKCEAILARAYEALKPFGSSPEAQRVLGKLSVVHAQMCVMTKQNVSALRYTAVARESFGALGFDYDVALVDALAGLAMIEVGKGGAHDMFEEAVLTLQRALQFFTSPEHRRVRWKILYYLAVGALLAGQHKGRSLDKLKWRDLAAGWVRSASDECAIIEKEGAQGLAFGVDAEFSPGLQPSALEPLQKALGMGGATRRKRSQRDIEAAVGPGDGYLH